MLRTKKLKARITELESALEKARVYQDYSVKKLEDDFNVLNQILDLKIKNYEDVVFVYNRYQEDKKVSVTTVEIEESTREIISDTFKTMSDQYIDYLISKYFSSKEAMVDLYTQRVYLRLFSYANAYNTERTAHSMNSRKKTYKFNTD